MTEIETTIERDPNLIIAEREYKIDLRDRREAMRFLEEKVRPEIMKLLQENSDLNNEEIANAKLVLAEQLSNIVKHTDRDTEVLEITVTGKGNLILKTEGMAFDFDQRLERSRTAKEYNPLEHGLDEAGRGDFLGESFSRVTHRPGETEFDFHFSTR